MGYKKKLAKYTSANTTYTHPDVIHHSNRGIVSDAHVEDDRYYDKLEESNRVPVYNNGRSTLSFRDTQDETQR